MEVKRDLFWVTMFPPVLKTLSEGAEVATIETIRFATFAKTE